MPASHLDAPGDERGPYGIVVQVAKLVHFAGQHSYLLDDAVTVPRPPKSLTDPFADRWEGSVNILEHGRNVDGISKSDTLENRGAVASVSIAFFAGENNGRVSVGEREEWFDVGRKVDRVRRS